MSNDTLLLFFTAIFYVAFYLYIVWRVGKIARQRGRNVYTWSVIGLLAPIPAMALVYILPDRASPNLSAAVQQF